MIIHLFVIIGINNWIFLLLYYQLIHDISMIKKIPRNILIILKYQYDMPLAQSTFSVATDFNLQFKWYIFWWLSLCLMNWAISCYIFWLNLSFRNISIHIFKHWSFFCWTVRSVVTIKLKRMRTTRVQKSNIPDVSQRMRQHEWKF